MMLIIAKI